MTCLVQVLYYKATSLLNKKGKGKHLNCAECPMQDKCSYGERREK